MTRLDIISDVVCPWCYLGKANLDRALSTRPDHPFHIRWMPFQLDPSIPPEGLDRAAYMARKFPPAQLAAAHARLEEMGAAAGITFRFDRIKRAPNTIDAHRVIRWAEAEQRQSAIAGELFRRYFTEGEDISDHDLLAEAAGAVGMEGTIIRQLLRGEADRAETLADIAAAGEMGVTGVPTFIVGRSYAISGAQPAETWLNLLAELNAL